jgi:hypothetical protein
MMAETDRYTILIQARCPPAFYAACNKAWRLRGMSQSEWVRQAARVALQLEGIDPAIAANPQKSNRAIAEEVGIGFETVRRARQSTDTGVSVETETRIGLDGKARRLPRREETKPEGNGAGE